MNGERYLVFVLSAVLIASMSVNILQLRKVGSLSRELVKTQVIAEKMSQLSIRQHELLSRLVVRIVIENRK